jgi:hypothetical protein
MPFTPFHLGPGGMFKALGGRYFSFTVFGFSQVAMDIEVLVRMYREDAILHGFTHTYVGATLIGILSFLIGKPICEGCLRLWNEAVSRRGSPRFHIAPRISWLAALMGAMIGTYSHVFLDSFMNTDMRPLAPFSDANPLLGLISADYLYLLCVGLGGLAAVLLLIISSWRKYTPEAIREKREKS